MFRGVFMAHIKTKNSIFAFLLILVLSVCFAIAFSSGIAYAGGDPVYLDFDIHLNGTGTYSGAGILAEADVWQSDDKTNWNASPFSHYEIQYFSGTSKLEEAPFEVGSYTAKVVSTYSGTDYLNTQDAPLTTGMVLKSFGYKIVYNHFAVSYTTPESLIADGDDHITDVSASIYCEGATLVEDSDYEVEIFFEDEILPTAEVREVGLYTIKITMLADFVTSNVHTDDTFTYEFYMVSTAVEASLESDSLYFTGDPIDPVLEGNITGGDFAGKFDVEYIETIGGSSNGARQSASPFSEVGNYTYRITFNDDLPSYGLEEGDHIDLAYSIVPKPFVINYYGDGASFGANNAIVKQSELGMTIAAVFSTLGGQVINTITPSDYEITYWRYDEGMFKGLPYDGYDHEKPTGVGRYKVDLTFTRDINGVFGAAHSGYTIYEDEIISYEFQIVNAVQYLYNYNNIYSGSPINLEPTLSYSATPIENTPALTLYEVKFYYDDEEQSVAPTEVGDYFGVIRFLQDYSHSGTTVAKAGDEYRFGFRICYTAPTITINYNEGVFEVACAGKESFVEDTDYTIETYLFKNGIYYITDDMSGLGTYRSIITIISEDKGSGLLAGDIYIKVINVAGGNPEAITMTVANFAYSGSAKPVTVNFGTGVIRTLNDEYTITYYDYVNDVINGQCGYPVLPGKYRALLTFNKEDAYFGISSGYQVVYDYTITPMSFNVTFIPVTDLVYDKTEKYFTAAFKANNRNVEINSDDYDIKFRSLASTDYADFSGTGYIDAGTYNVAAVFNTDNAYRKYGINIVEEAYVKEQSFDIQTLNVRLDFILPVEEEAMYRTGGLEPEVEFYKMNGNLNTLSDVPVKNVDYMVSYRFGSLYGVSYEEVPIVGKPTDTGRYLINLSTQFNENITLHSVTETISGGKSGIDYSGICYADYLDSDSATAVFRIIPLPLDIVAVFPDSMYEDGTAKGCAESELELSTVDVTSGVGGVYDSIEVSDDVFLNSGLMTIDYYRRQSGGTATIGDPLGGVPILAGDYTLRVYFSRAIGEIDPDEFSRYSIVGGKNSFGEDTDRPIQTGFYLDIPYRIEESEEIRVIFNKPASFAYDGTDKAFSISFACGDSAVTLEPLTDYQVQYNSTSSSQATPYGDSGIYWIEVTFVKAFPQYKVILSEGTYEKADESVRTITVGDTVRYDYEIFEPYILDWDWIQPDTLFYDGTLKNYVIRFFDKDDIDATVTLIYNIDYAIRYYKKSAEGSTYSLLTAAPSTPITGVDNYIAELIFLRPLPDYRIFKNNDINEYDIQSYVQAKAEKDEGTVDPIGLSIQDNGGVLNAEIQRENRHQKFDISKGVLEISQISVKNKSFDNSKAAEIEGTPVLTAVSGGKVMVGGSFKYTLEGSVQAEFNTVGVGENIAVNVISGYTLSSDGADYYVLQYKPLKANITKLNIVVTPISTPRQYNPFYVDADNLTFGISANASSILASTLGISADAVLNEAFTGALTRVGALGVNDNVGSYPILIGTLALVGDEVTLADTSESTLDANIILTLEADTYDIIPRTITITVDEGQYKYYGDPEPSSYGYTITSGSLLFNDCFVGTATRETTEGSGGKDRVGFYSISLASIRIFDRNGEGVDVTSNYSVTRISKVFEVKKKSLSITPVNQTVTFGASFNATSVKVGNTIVTPENIGTILNGDVFAGRLGLEDTGERTETIARRYRITLGTLCIRNSSGKDVTHNYSLVFNTSQNAYYTINKQSIRLAVADSVILEKVYGNADPKIAFKVLGTPLSSAYTFDISSTLSRTAGETAGTYNILDANVNNNIKILEGGINVTDYFNFDITNRDDQNRIVQFTILPREITVKIKDETVTKSNMTILPKLEYLDTDNKPLSAALIAALSISYSVPPIEFVEGANVITPIITGSVTTDANFAVNLASGTVTVVFPENTLSQEEVPEEDVVFNNNKIVYSDFRVFNSVKMYQFATDNGENPSRQVKATIPVTEDLMGKNLYVLAVYQDGSIQLLNATVEDNEIVFEDDNFYYVLVGTLAVWPYVLLGVGGFVLLGGGIAMVVSHHIRRKKRIAAGLIQPKQKKQGKRPTPSRVVDEESEDVGLVEENDTIAYNPDSSVLSENEEIITSTNRLEEYSEKEALTDNYLSDDDKINSASDSSVVEENEERIITSSNTRRFDSDEADTSGKEGGDDLL